MPGRYVYRFYQIQMLRLRYSQKARAWHKASASSDRIADLPRTTVRSRDSDGDSKGPGHSLPHWLSPYLLTQAWGLGGPSWVLVPGRKIQMRMKQLFLGNRPLKEQPDFSIERKDTSLWSLKVVSDIWEGKSKTLNQRDREKPKARKMWVMSTMKLCFSFLWQGFSTVPVSSPKFSLFWWHWKKKK